jgi:glycosyltransferase involved in cell wall biosynthesis
MSRITEQNSLDGAKADPVRQSIAAVAPKPDGAAPGRSVRGPHVLVIHETDGRKYFEALSVLQQRGALSSLQFAGASVVWKFAHSLIRERKPLLDAAHQSWHNLLFRLKFWKIQNHTVILCVPPWDYRFVLYSFLRRRNTLIFNTSWPYWTEGRVPCRFLSPVMRWAWSRILGEQHVKVVAVTSQAAQGVSTAIALGQQPTVIPHVVSDAFFKVRAKYSLPFRLLFIGELSRKKGLLELSALLDALESDSVAIDIVGNGELSQVAKQLAKRPNYRWFGQVRDRAELARIAANCQIMVSPALRNRRWEELFGISILESMAAGLPCIVSGHVGPRSIITSGIDGVLVPEHATEEIAGWVRKLEARPDEWKSISNHAVETARKYSVSAIADRWQRALTCSDTQAPLGSMASSRSKTLSRPAIAKSAPRARDRRVRVVSISHSAVFHNARLRYVPLAKSDEIDLTVIVPHKWNEYGKEYVAEPPTPALDIRIRTVRFRDAGIAKWYMHYYPGLAKFIEEVRPDVLHLWEEPWSFIALHAARLCSRFGMSLVLETDQNILRRLPPPFEQIRRYTLQRTDTLIVRSPEALEVSRACGFRGQAATVEYCFDPNEFRPLDRASARAEFPTEGFTIGYAGRLVAEKGLFTVLDALYKCDQNVRFLLLGDGPDRGRLQRRANELGLANRVSFFAGVPPDKVVKFINALDCLVLMSETTRSWKEQFGRVIMEAHACGVPVIGSDSGSIPAVVERGGWIVSEKDSIALRTLLDRLAVSPWEVAAAAKAARRQAVTRFSQKKVSSDFRDALLRSVAGEKAQSRIDHPSADASVSSVPEAQPQFN